MSPTVSLRLANAGDRSKPTKRRADNLAVLVPRRHVFGHVLTSEELGNAEIAFTGQQLGAGGVVGAKHGADGSRSGFVLEGRGDPDEIVVVKGEYGGDAAGRLGEFIDDRKVEIDGFAVVFQQRRVGFADLHGLFRIKGEGLREIRGQYRRHLVGQVYADLVSRIDGPAHAVHLTLEFPLGLFQRQPVGVGRYKKGKAKDDQTPEKYRGAHELMAEGKTADRFHD